MKALLVASVLAFCATVSVGLKCYECLDEFSGRQEKFPAMKCLDAFIPGEKDAPSDTSEVPQVECAEYQGSCYKTIASTYQSGGSGKYIASYRITRGCLNSTEPLEECEVGQAHQGNQATCFCGEDLCNTATTSYVSFGALILSLLFVAFKLH